MLLQVVLEGERPAVRRAAHVAAELEIVVLLVGLDVRADGVERGERPRALGAPERLRVTILVAGQLYPRLERLRAVRARVGALLAVRQQVMIVDGGRLEAFAAVLAGVGPYARVRAHVKGQAVGHAEGLAANLPKSEDITIVSERGAKDYVRLRDFCITSSGLSRATMRRKELR